MNKLDVEESFMRPVASVYGDPIGVRLHHSSGTTKEQERTGQTILFERLQKYVTKLSRRDKLSHIRVC